MKGYYEKTREESDEIFFRRNTNHEFPPHFHSNLELLVVKSGSYKFNINKEQYVVTNGQIAFIDSYDVHSYSKWENDGENYDDFLLAIPKKHLYNFNDQRKNKKAEEQIISNSELCDTFIEIADKYINNKSTSVQISAVNLIMSLLFDSIRWINKRESEDTILIRKILNYIDLNFKNNISRNVISKELGYAEAYISRVFHQYMGQGLSEYINYLRFCNVENLEKADSKRKISDIIFESGFSSPQTYYRWKKRLE